MRNITAQAFKAYLEVQLSSKYNMFSQYAIYETGLDEVTYKDIQKYYKKLVEQYRDNEECEELLNELGY